MERKRWTRPQIDPKFDPTLSSLWRQINAIHWPGRSLPFNEQPNATPRRGSARRLQADDTVDDSL